MPQGTYADNRVIDKGQDRKRALVALGSNLSSAMGKPAEILEIAVGELEKRGAVLCARSHYFRTPAFPKGSGPDFVNAALCIETSWTAHETLAHLHDIEAWLGRQRIARWGARVVDLDLLAVEDVILPDVATVRHWMALAPAQQQRLAPAELILPHPRMHQRSFVLVPLAEIAADWQHPITCETVRQMRDALPADDLSSVIAL